MIKLKDRGCNLGVILKAIPYKLVQGHVQTWQTGLSEQDASFSAFNYHLRQNTGLYNYATVNSETNHLVDELDRTLLLCEN